MGVLEDLKRLSAAEDFFQYLEVSFDPRILHVARLHILKRMGEYLADVAPAQSEEALRARCRTQLDAAYRDFVERTPIEERVFKVHKDAVAIKPGAARQFVALTPLGPRARQEG